MRMVLIVAPQELKLNREINLLSDELDAIAGAAMNDGTNFQKWQNDPSPDKLPWNPAFPPGGANGGPIGTLPHGGRGPVR
jgi:hypothetical protein